MKKSKRFFHAILVIIFITIFYSPSYANEKEINALSARINDSSIKMAEKVQASGKKTIAVFDFIDIHSNITELGRFLAEEFSVAFTKSAKDFQVIDRTHLNTFLQEHKLNSEKGLIDPDTAKKLKKITGADAIITGMITPLDENIRVAVKIMDTETANIIDAEVINIAKTKFLEDMVNNQVDANELYENKASDTKESSSKSTYQDIGGMLKVMLKSFQLVGKNEVVASLSITNIMKQKEGADSVAVAHKKVPSSLPPGYDEFLGNPIEAVASVIDDKGNSYKYVSSSGLGFGKNDSDWAMFRRGQTISVTITFKNKDDSENKNAGSIFKLNCEILVVFREEKKAEVKMLPFNIYIDNIKPK